jgi:gluconate 2-dehydrogenase gamma chain
MLGRREFLLAAAALPLYPAGPLQFFTSEEAALIESLCDQAVPADDYPGARQTGVLYYIDRQLAGPLKRFGPAYREQIPAFRQACRETTGNDFLQLEWDRQTRFLEAVDSGEVKGLGGFFRMVVDHTMQGYYGSPKHGGNREEASWKMLEIVAVMREEHHH